MTQRSEEAAGVHGVVLAAGRSERMGGPKALLAVANRTLLAHAAGCLRAGGCSDVWLVVSRAMPEVAYAAAGLGTVVLAPDDAGAQPLDSIRLALAAVPETAEGLLILPVDCPFVSDRTVGTILERGAGAAGAVPLHDGRPGHPVLIGRQLFETLRTADLPEGLRSLLAREGPGVTRIEVDDAAVLVDLDTPEDARAWGVPA